MDATSAPHASRSVKAVDCQAVAPILKTKSKSDETPFAETVNRNLLFADFVSAGIIVRHTEETLQRLRTLPVREKSLIPF